MSIIEALKLRSEKPTDDVKIELKLYTLADALVKMARAHLKRITRIMPEFDLHDEKHSEKVIYNQEKLLGEEQINNLSSYELFLIQLAAFFHDCAMAPSDWELKVMKFTEGTNDFFIESDSIRNDLKKPFKTIEAIEFIKSNKCKLYNEFKGDVENWLFSSTNEKDLIEYLANLLVDYQDYRNGFADHIKSLKNKQDFERLNDYIRIDYIRATHPTRIEIYIKNLESIFCNAFEQRAWGKQLANDLAKICRSHGEDASYIYELSTCAQYYGNESANLQLIAILLRLGDIIHFSFDRAPIELRSSRIFKSEYSFLQWAIKSNGVNYSIENGKISFRAYCEQPELYFKLHQYIDYIEIEIQNYFRLERLWNKKIIKNLQDKVDRTNINNDEEAFLPKRGLSFSLNQKRIIELLMGVGLYKDKFACLRELYQNSLDACRCMLSQNEALNKTVVGKIEFGLQEDADKTFLYCFDNGIGMSKHIIENYLLNIGNSYYKSSEYYKYQAKWRVNFTPTSQFGIGISSCFMIGTKIEITTKTIDGEYISCSIDGPNENFYYKKTTNVEKESIPESGTIVKVLLNEDKILSNSKIEKLGLLLLQAPPHFPDKFKDYKNLYQAWNNHLYNKVNSFIKIIPENIKVIIKLNNDEIEEIDSKPIIVEENKFGIINEDMDFLNFLKNYRRVFPVKISYNEVKDFLEVYKIEIKHKEIQYTTTILLPKPGLKYHDINLLYCLPEVGCHGICIDGIEIERTNQISLSHFYSNELMRDGILNFIGENRPQLSVDRTSLINYSDEHEIIATTLVKELLKEIIKQTEGHIKKYQINENDPEFYLIWEFIFKKFGYADTIFINELSYTEYGNIIYKNLTDAIGEKITINEYLKRNEIIITNYNLSNYDILTQKLILFKLLSANEINITSSTLKIKTEKLYKAPVLNRRNDFEHTKLLVNADNWEEIFKDYDIVSECYPIVPKYLFEKIDSIEGHIKIRDRAKLVESFENGIAAFFNQSPLLINESLGLYVEERNSFGRKKNSIYNFERKRNKFQLFELNERAKYTKNKTRQVITVYISPKELDTIENDELDKIKEKDREYYKGVKEGWSILVTGMEKNNLIISAGKITRNELVSKLPKSFWIEYKDFEFFFPNGLKMNKCNYRNSEIKEKAIPVRKRKGAKK